MNDINMERMDESAETEFKAKRRKRKIWKGPDHGWKKLK